MRVIVDDDHLAVACSRPDERIRTDKVNDLAPLQRSLPPDIADVVSLNGRQSSTYSVPLCGASICNRRARETPHVGNEWLPMIYCPYSDTELSQEQSNSEHIIPLVLGGVNGFEIRVDATFNSRLGSELDGALANEFVFGLRRTQFNARGHSGKEPWVTLKQANLADGRPVQVRLHQLHGTRIWDPRARKLVSGSQKFSLRTTMNLDLPVRFAAKVALSAGYFAYGDLFRYKVDHRQLRDVMCIDPRNLDLASEDTLGLEHITLRVDNYMMAAPTEPENPLGVLRCFCNAVQGSVVILIPGRECFWVTVGLLGQYLATLIVPANTEDFPKSGIYSVGHVLAIVDGALKRISWRSALDQLAGITD